MPMVEPAHLGAGPEHWNAVHERRTPDQLTWYQPTPQKSLALIELAGLGPSHRIVDVGGGSSRLCDELIDAGYLDVTVVDISVAALAHVAARISTPGDRVSLVEQDVGDFRSDRPFDLWHDRAVFHFLTDEHQRDRYVGSLAANLSDRGHVLMASFGLDGPDTCSGLPVMRYGADSLSAALGPWLEAIDFEEEVHVTPAGGTQHFIYGLFRRIDRRAQSTSVGVGG